MTTLQNVVDFLQANGQDPFENCSTPEPIDINLVCTLVIVLRGVTD